MDLTIAITSMNNRELLEKCLDSVFRETEGISFEVIVIDNVSTDGSAEMVAEKHPTVTLLRNEKPLNFCENNNLMFERAKGEFVLILNDDTELLEGAPAKMVAFMRERPDAGAVGCRLLNPDLSLQPSAAFNFPSLLSDFCELSRINALIKRFSPNAVYPGKYKLSDSQFDREWKVTGLIGACLLMRRSALELTGGFDPELPCYRNETDLLLRMHKKGMQAYYTPVARVIHHGGATFSREPNMLERTYRDYHRFYRKHYGAAADNLYALMLVVNSLSGMFYYGLRSLLTRDPAAREIVEYHRLVLRCQFRKL